jgi:hypothetical protein
MAQSDVSWPEPTPAPKPRPVLEIYCRRCSATTMRIITVPPVILWDDELPFGDEWQPIYRCPTCDGVLKLSDSASADQVAEDDCAVPGQAGRENPRAPSAGRDPAPSRPSSRI